MAGVLTLLQLDLSPGLIKQGELPITCMQLVHNCLCKSDQRIFHYTSLTSLVLRQVDLTAFELKCKSSK